MSNLFNNNIQWLRDILNPQLAEKLANHNTAVEVIGNLQDNSLNIKNNKNNELFYPNGFNETLQAEFKAFQNNPSQYRLPIDFSTKSRRATNQPDWDPRGDEIHNHFLQEISKKLEINDIKFQEKKLNGSFLILFGIGLGLQVLTYLKLTSIKSIIIYEPNIDLLHASFLIIDWKSISEILQSRGGELTFILPQAPEIAGNIILHTMRGKNFDEVDGSYIIKHYKSKEIELAYHSFQANINILAKGYGFLEDEIRMYENTFKNIYNTPIKKLEPKYYNLDIDMPAFIVGSGPSLDHDYDFLKTYRSRIIIFSSGTALSALVNAGITPDFHCEIENQIHVFKVLSHIDPKILKKIPIICPTTVRNDVTRLFKETVFIVRDSVTPSRLYFSKDDLITLAASNATNLSTTTAALFGFKNIHFLGVDMGSKTPEIHHSKESVYMKVKDKFYNQSFNLPQMSIEIPAQRGGSVFTNATYCQALDFLSLVIENFRTKHKFYNGSDGALIPNTETIITSEISIGYFTHHHQEIVDSILGESIDITPPLHNMKIIHNQFKKLLTIFYEYMLQLTTADQNISYQQFKIKLRPYLLAGENDLEHDIKAAVRSLGHGSFLSILQILNFIEIRIGQEDWDRIWPDLREEIHLAILEMRTKIKIMFDECDQVLE